MRLSPLQGASGTHYWEADVELAPETEELWSLFCYDLGASGAQALGEAPGRLKLRYFFENGKPEPAARWSAAFKARYPALRPPFRIELRRRAVENWQENWRVHFVPIPAGRGLMICPPWDVPQGEALGGRRPLLIEPGQGFGTGGHASTVLALEQIEAVLGGPTVDGAPEHGASAGGAPMAILDVGIGSGILSLAARMLGVPVAWGLDIDGRVMAEVRRNFALNGLAPAPALIRGGPDCLRRRFPLVVANLTTEVLLAHKANLFNLLAPGATLIMSGILLGEREKVMGPYLELGCRLENSSEREGWWACRMLAPAPG